MSPSKNKDITMILPEDKPPPAVREITPAIRQMAMLEFEQAIADVPAPLQLNDEAREVLKAWFIHGVHFGLNVGTSYGSSYGGTD